MRAGSELVFHGGAIFDGSRFLPAGTAVRVSGGQISYVGPAADAGQLGPAEPIDLDGGTLLPGFIDAHVHPVFAGDRLRRCDLSGARTAAQYQAIIAAFAAANPDGPWITGGGWFMEAFPGGVPTKDLLDAVVSDRPVFLPNRDGHGAWVNSRALELAGITAASLDPADGRIERDQAGEPNGCLQEGAANLVSRLVPAASTDDWYAGLLAAQDYLLSLGITGWQDAIVGRGPEGPDPIDAYLRAAGDGTLAANVVGALWWDRHRGIEQVTELVERRREVQAGVQGGRFRATSVKMMLDGVAENHTAAMLEPYLDGHGCSTGGSGLDFIDPAELPLYVTELDTNGFQVHFHALGDRAVRNALDAIEAARRAANQVDGAGVGKPGGQRHHLAHLQVVHPDDIPRFAELNATANIQALWAMHEPQMDDLTIPFLGERRSGWQYPFGALLAAGAPMCGGSDWSVSTPDPLLAGHVAVNRTLPQAQGGSGQDPFLPEQAISTEAFFAAYTSGSARVNGLEDVVGAVRPGLDADFAITDADLATGPPTEIGQASVVQTWIRGEPRYQHSLANPGYQPRRPGQPRQPRAPPAPTRHQGGQMGTKTSRRAAMTAATAAVTAVLALAACGRSASSGSGNSGDVSPTQGLVATTPAGTKPVSSVVWAVYRDVNSLDPIFAFDYPENTAVSLMCESLLKQAPDGAIDPGLATMSNPSPTKLVFTINSAAKFWDGHPVTPADVVYSLDRAMDAKLGGFYLQVFTRVSSIAATGSDQVTITLKQPDYWLPGELSSMPGVIIEKAFVQQQGKNYGTPAGKIMCTGAYEFKSFTPGVGVTATANPSYWNSAVKTPLASQITLKGVPDTTTYTSGLETGAIQGGFTMGLSTLPQLKSSPEVKVYQGPGWATDAFIVSNLKGVLGSEKVRQALSLALNRQAIISSVYKGGALMPRWISNPGTFGYGVKTFVHAYDQSPVMTQNVAKARKLIKEAGADGKTFTIGTSSQLSNIAAVAGAYQQAAQAIGLKTKLDSVSAQNFINFFIDPKARAGVDGFLTQNYGDYADPAAMLTTLVLPEGSQNFDHFNDPKIIALLDQARGTANPDKRAALVAQVEELAAVELPWIPNVQPTNLTIMSKGLTGATGSFAYMFAPWANTLGGTG